MFVYAIPRLCLAFTASVVLTGQAQAATLIRCPDWQSLMPKTAALRSTPTTNAAFDQAIRRATNQRSAKTRIAAQTTGPLDAAGIFSRDGGKATAKHQASAACPTHTVRKGDTLAKIAKARLGSAKRYPELMTANAGKVKTAKTLRVGTVLTLPCAQPTRQTASLQGKTRSGADQSGSTRAKTAPDAVPVPAKPKLANQPLPMPAKPMTRLPVWTARPGEFVSDVIDRWAKRAGHTVVRDGVEEWKISVPVKIRGSFKHALDQLVVGFEGAGRPLAISLYANKVIRIGRPL